MTLAVGKQSHQQGIQVVPLCDHTHHPENEKRARYFYLTLPLDSIGAPGAIRTPDPLVRSQVLYQTELRAPCRV